MKIDWQHIALFLAPILVAVGNGIQEHWSPMALAALLTAIGGGAGLALKPSVSSTVNEVAAVKAAAEQVLK